VPDRLESLGAAPLAERSAVLAVGSNAAPARLADKCGAAAVIPVARAKVAGWAAVYSAHISTYGSIAATLWSDPMSTSSLAVTFLDPHQLGILDASEANYVRVDLGPLIDGWEGSVTGYRSRRGALSFDGGPIRLAAVPARSPLPALGELEVLDEVAARSTLSADGTALATGVATGAIERTQILDWMVAGRSLPPPSG